ncbi:MAG: cobyric acid synthase [Desulfohalobiaceae bacterium]
MPQKFEHGGNIHKLARMTGQAAEDLLDFSASINPLGPPIWLQERLPELTRKLVHYPDPEAHALLEAAAQRYRLPSSWLLAANGSTEILYHLPRIALDLQKALIPVPAYVDYERISRLAGLNLDFLHLDPEQGFALPLHELNAKLQEPALVFLAQPNNPTGQSLPVQEVQKLMQSRPESLFVIDEAFADFLAPQQRFAPDLPPNALLLLSLTKFFAIPGLRLGLAAGQPELLHRLRQTLPPWSVNSLAQEIGTLALQDMDYQQRSRSAAAEYRAQLEHWLSRIPDLHVFPAEANFLLCRIQSQDLSAEQLRQKLLQKGVLIRDCSNFQGLGPEYFRIAVRSPQQNQRLVQGLEQVLSPEGHASTLAAPGPRPRNSSRSRPTPALMLQGTSSNAGKSILATALCRILLQDGFQPAPFKAQNMSLNSFVTKDGGEMGRAQVLQAQACRMDPEVLMNPVLLKPNSETGSQVILLGRAVRNMDVQDYIRYKEEIRHSTRQAYDQLAARSGVMVLEGAGSPAEINLKSHDLTNMAIAGHAAAQVLLVGDIDRGGVFASFVGTMELLEAWEQELVCGFVVNKFRGQERLLDPALEYTLQRTSRPVLGVVPYIQDLGLPEEDSVSFKSGWDKNQTQGRRDCVRIACVDLPHISNFTDLEALLPEPDVSLQIVKSPQDLDPDLDLLILPGSKSVLSDLEFLRRSGLDQEIVQLARGGRTRILGICGGFQMLGEKVADPLQVESEQESSPGLGLLPVITEMGRDKTLTQARGLHLPSGQEVQGYEIHHGQTRTTSQLAQEAVQSQDGRQLGYAHAELPVWGTYLHGLFDADGFRRWLLDSLRQQRGLAPLVEPKTSYDLEEKLDLLADTVRRHLDLDYIYRQLGLS